jgi:predicted Zn-dependent protease
MRLFTLRRGLLYIVLVTLAHPACARNPVTGQLQLALVTEAQEIAMGRQGAEDVERSLGMVPDAALQKYVQGIGASMAKRSERPELPWRFGVVDDPTPNAFALPGGFIYFTRGMLSLMNSEAELASVLGHEIGHVTARHQVAMLSRAQLAQVGLGLGGVLFPELEQLGGVAGAGLSLLFLRYGRDAERQADEIGFRYALDQQYDAREMASVFASLARLGDQQQRSPIPAWLQTHPLPAERIKAVEERAAELDRPTADLRINRAEFMARIDGMVYGANPRHGFFREGVFLHPDLRFQFRVPARWQTQNLTQAVIAVSPEQNAAIQLTISPDASPDAAARRFLQQQGLQPGRATRQPVNGLPAVIATFLAQTQQGVVQGLVGFIAYDGRVYQLLAFAPRGVFARYEPEFTRSIGSFDRLTDSAALKVQPDRIATVRLKESITVAEFNRRFPSAIPVAELAIINGVAAPDSPLPAGAVVKRIVGG